MPQTYYDFDPWKRAADNIASGMVAVAQARNRKAMFDAEMQQRAPLVEAQTRNYNANAAKDEYSLERAKSNDEQDMLDAAELEKEVRKVGDRYEFTERGIQIFGRSIMRKSTGATDMTGGMENLLQGSNYEQLEQQKINKPVEMNEGTRLVDPRTGKTIAVGNTKLNQGQSLFTPDDTSVGYNVQPSAKGDPKSASTSREQSIRLQALKEEYIDTIRELRKAGTVTGQTDEATAMNYNKLQKRRNELERLLGLSENNSLTPAPSGVNTPVTNAVPTLRIVRGPDGKPMFVQ